MEFSSTFFLFAYLPVILFFFLIFKRQRHASLLLIISLVYYFAIGGKALILMLMIIAFNYLVGYLIDGEDSQIVLNRKIILVLGILVNVAVLFGFKYILFIIENINGLLAGINWETIPLPDVSFPPGISFFTFLNISYIVDVYRGSANRAKNPLHYGLYITFFPKMMMGPITLYSQFIGQIRNIDKNRIQLYDGTKRFILGLGKKVLIADSVSAIVNSVFELPAQHLTFSLVWVGAIAYSVQIYFDFSGYSDMAIGLGKIFGLHIPENFNFPYAAKSIKDFWKRWHITLAAWLQTYLFLPVAYAVLRRFKQPRVLRMKTENVAYYIGSFITMSLCGLWHGANWTFVVWGVYFGILLIIEHAWLGKILKKKCNRIVRVFYSNILILIGWAIFRSDNIDYGLAYVKAMLGFGSGDGQLFYPALFLNRETVFFLLLGIIAAFPILPFLRKHVLSALNRFSIARWKKSGNTLMIVLEQLLLFGVFMISLMMVVSGTYKPFIYFNF